MTAKEQDIITNLLRQIRDANDQFQQDIAARIIEIEARTAKKLRPIYLEQDILQTAQESIAAAIKAALQTDYNSPVKKLIISVIEENSVELKALIEDSFRKVIRTDDFKQSIVSAFAHKVARSIISNNDGLFDRVSNELKKDAAFKAKMTIAVANVVDECMKTRVSS